MTTFNAIQLTCPLCEKPMGHYELASYIVGRSIVFSDGKVEHDNSYFEDKILVVCPHCTQIFWRDDAREQAIEYSDDQESLPFSNTVLDLETIQNENMYEGIILFYNNLLDTGFANNKTREIYLRILLWRSVNDLIRYQKPLLKIIDLYVIKNLFYFIKSRCNTRKIFKKFSQLHHDNLRKLSIIFNPIDENEQLMQAEMYRELGEFKQALNLINKIKPHAGRHIQQIKKAALFRRKRVFRLN